MAGCPMCRRLITAIRRFFGTLILSSMNTRPNRLHSFLLCVWYSSGIISCCCRSRHTSVLSKLGPFVVSVISSCRSVAKFIAGTSRTDRSWSVSESISPSSMGIGADDGPGLSIWFSWTGVGRSISRNGSTVHCSE